MKLNIPVGVSDFEQIRKNGYYYIDKSGLIAEILKRESVAVTLITRPRRFGKTLGMSMLANFLDIRKDSRELFENLSISKNVDLCDKWMNKCPTIFLSFKDVDGLNFDSAYDMLSATIADLYKEHLYLLDSDKINEYDKEIIKHIVENRATVTEVKKSLYTLIKAMKMHYGSPAILLLDEYDVPIAKASSNGYYVEMLDIIKALMSTALKDNTSLKFAVMTGCMRIAKESIFTGTNNMVSDSIVASGLNEYFGFTQDNVEKLLYDADMLNHADDIKEWYDGYHFGKFDVYCPWDVMNYIRDLKNDITGKPVSYWKNTSDNAIIRSFIDIAGNSIAPKLETLMAGGYIIQRVEENLTYDFLHSSEDNLWSVLYLTGYLTKVRENELNEELPDDMTALIIPNKEIQEIYETTVQKWFVDSAKNSDRKSLFAAVWSGNIEKLTKELNTLLRMTISYHDYGEDFYHAFLAGIFAGAGYMVQSNKEHGEGRSDIVVMDSRGGRVAIFEAKYVKEVSRMNNACEDAILQIKEKMYAEDFSDSYDQVLVYGIAFYKKRCMVKCADKMTTFAD